MRIFGFEITRISKDKKAACSGYRFIVEKMGSISNQINSDLNELTDLHKEFLNMEIPDPQEIEFKEFHDTLMKCIVCMNDIKRILIMIDTHNKSLVQMFVKYKQNELTIPSRQISMHENIRGICELVKEGHQIIDNSIVCTFHAIELHRAIDGGGEVDWAKFGCDINSPEEAMKQITKDLRSMDAAAMRIKNHILFFSLHFINIIDMLYFDQIDMRYSDNKLIKLHKQYMSTKIEDHLVKYTISFCDSADGLNPLHGIKKSKTPVNNNKEEK